MFAFGILAALCAPLTMTIGIILWDEYYTGSSFSLNLIKCSLASCGFLVVVLIQESSTLNNNNINDAENNDDKSRILVSLFPSEKYTTETLGYLVLSALIGILIGDWAWLQGLQLLGARKTIFIDCVKPFVAAILGAWILNEQLQWPAILGMFSTILGILLVSLTDKRVQEIETTTSTGKEPSLDDEEKSCPPIENLPSSSPVSVLDDSYEKNNFVVEGTNEGGASSSISSVPGEGRILPEEKVIHCRSSPGGCVDNVQSINSSSTTTVHTISAAATTTTHPPMTVGYMFAVSNVILDTYGAVLIKQFGSELTAWEINLVRFGSVSLLLISLSAILRLWERLFGRYCETESTDVPSGGGGGDGDATNTTTSSNRATQGAVSGWYRLPTMDRTSWTRVLGGVMFVTFWSPVLSNYALFEVALGLALTLGSVGPLYSLVLSYFFLQQPEKSTHIRAQEWMGSLLAIAGIAILAWKGQSS